MIERRPQSMVVVVLERDEAEGLQNALLGLVRRAEDFRHAVHRAGLRLKRNFHKIALGQRLFQTQQAARGRNGLEFSSSAPAIF